MLWYLYIEGRCKGNEEINKPFGYFVHAFISSKKLDEAVEITSEHLSDEGLDIIDIIDKGLFSSFTWEDESKKKEINRLAKIAERVDEFPIFSEFYTWKL
jgi:hypothetical protein